MNKLPSAPIPLEYKSIVLINPTRYLGNLLIAGGLIQDFYAHCAAKDIRFLLVCDEAYRPLLEHSLPTECLLFYPRNKINKSKNYFTRASAYLRCLKQIRAFKADIAFNIEEDSTSDYLTRWSGAKFKLGSSKHRHSKAYDLVLDVDTANRPTDRKHRWYGFAQVFSTLYKPQSEPSYLQPDLSNIAEPKAFKDLDFSNKIVALHVSATKDYKKWPLTSYRDLVKILDEAGYKLVLIGAGSGDQETNKRLLAMLAADNVSLPLNLCDRLSLIQLAQLFAQIQGIVGNDSGPSHLASAMQTPGCIIFGPTDIELWKPMSACSSIIEHKALCDPKCTKRHCLREHRCLKSIEAKEVAASLAAVMANRA